MTYEWAKKIQMSVKSDLFPMGRQFRQMSVSVAKCGASLGSRGLGVMGNPKPLVTEQF